MKREMLLNQSDTDYILIVQSPRKFKVSFGPKTRRLLSDTRVTVDGRTVGECNRDHLIEKFNLWIKENS